MKNSNLYPFQDTITPLLSGETWIDIPGFEGSFMVSNLGRLKSLDREVSHARCGTQFVKGRVLKQNIKRHYNNHKEDYVYILQATLMLENKRHEFSVRRLVYFSFKNPTMLNFEKWMVVSRDNDGFNCRLNNLILRGKDEHLKFLIKENRTPFTQTKIDRKSARPTFNLWKPVHRCDTNGEVIETYPCIAHAAVKFGCYEKGISMATKNGKSYRGFRWKLANREMLEEIMRYHPRKKRVRVRRKQ